jgi:phage gp36-like protein
MAAQPYISIADLVSRQTERKLKQILDLDDDEDLYSDTRISACVDDANSYAETYIRRQSVTFPENQTPSVLKRYTSEVAMNFLLSYKEQNASEEDNRKWQDVKDWFEKVGTGEIDLVFVSKKDTNKELLPVNVVMRDFDVRPDGRKVKNPYGAY